MKKSIEYDCKCVERILGYIQKLKDMQERFKVHNLDDFNKDDIYQLATAQIFTNIYETEKNIQESTLDKLTVLKKLNLKVPRNIASHDYESLDFAILYRQVIQLLNSKLTNELEAFINDNKRNEGSDF